ncbi:MAG: YbhB/YbcL family Raf kinase inhibitor-like protein [Limnoraphis robusta]|uniref:YbhB/YbcL family Raf kinase inhibitor-like protein n=1 Tax=Limnoraphis robusta TaxID=1118279 RepID=UPI0009E50793|nr:YbhB/YbcL family Raf kinase inhibitor-like protein [Limnoraphis robusta]
MGLNIKNLRIVSPAFTAGDRIPKRYTSEGENVSPALEWSGLPSGTQQLALICHDPDAPMPRGFTHWVLYGIPATVNQLAEADGPHHYYFE